MKTLIILSHPTLESSGSQQFLVNSIKDNQDVTLHHLESVYPDGVINREVEQELLKTHQRIIFQFPFYWYSSPALLKEWQDVVFGGSAFYTPQGTILAGKQFGLVVNIGVSKNEYRAGGRESFTIDELTRPYQAIAKHMEMTYLPVLGIHQFSYLSEAEKKALLTDYQYYLTGVHPASLSHRTDWLIHELNRVKKESQSTEKNGTIDRIVEEISSRQQELLELKEALKEY